jgi:hypothetical protein
MKTLFNWLLGIEHDVESLVSPLRRLVDDLKAHAEKKEVERAQHIADVTKSSALANAAFAEADKARSVADKIGALVN